MSNLNYTKDQLIEEFYSFSHKNIKKDKVDEWKDYIATVYKKHGFKNSEDFKILNEAESLIFLLNETTPTYSSNGNFGRSKRSLESVENKFKFNITFDKIPERLHGKIVNIVSEFAPRGKDLENYIHSKKQNSEQNL